MMDIMLIVKWTVDNEKHIRGKGLSNVDSTWNTRERMVRKWKLE